MYCFYAERPCYFGLWAILSLGAEVRQRDGHFGFFEQPAWAMILDNLGVQVGLECHLLWALLAGEWKSTSWRIQRGKARQSSFKREWRSSLLLQLAISKHQARRPILSGRGFKLPLVENKSSRIIAHPVCVWRVLASGAEWHTLAQASA